MSSLHDTLVSLAAEEFIHPHDSLDEILTQLFLFHGGPFVQLSEDPGEVFLFALYHSHVEAVVEYEVSRAGALWKKSNVYLKQYTYPPQLSPESRPGFTSDYVFGMGRILQGSSKTVPTGDATGYTVEPKATQELISGSKLSYKEKPVDAMHDLELPDWVKRCDCSSDEVPDCFNKLLHRIESLMWQTG